MAPLGYIEILDAKGGVIERVPVDSFPIAIGRAYSNDVILNDPYVCPVHLAIEPDEEGRLIARDLNSVNGLRADAREKRVPFLELHSGSEFLIGHTPLRYCSVDYPLAATVVDRVGGRRPLHTFPADQSPGSTCRVLEWRAVRGYAQRQRPLGRVPARRPACAASIHSSSAAPLPSSQPRRSSPPASRRVRHCPS